MVSPQYAIGRPIQLYDFDHHEQPKGKKTTPSFESSLAPVVEIVAYHPGRKWLMESTATYSNQLH